VSVRAGRFCDFTVGPADKQEPCPLPAAGTCALCSFDFCSDHSTADRALSVSVGISRQTPGSGALHTTKVIEKTGAMCERCTKAFTDDPMLQLQTAEAAREAAVQALAAAQVARALASETGPRTS